MKIITLTINPALDKSAKIDELIPFEKLECSEITYHPGGGGINISRVLNRLNTKSLCVFPYGGKTGEHLIELLREENIETTTKEISSLTRENFAVFDKNSNLQYRFGMPTAPFSETEITALENIISDELTSGDIFVISGSLPKGLPKDYYSKLIQKLATKNIRIIVDTSGAAFNEILNNEVYLIKPNRSELAALAGKTFLSSEEQEYFALELIKNRKAEFVVVSLGKQGAFIAHKNGIDYVNAPNIIAKSTIGAGDSMVAGLIHGIIHNETPKNMLRWGVACGVSATMSEGSDLAHKNNIENVLKTL